jgi:hypothetical protein
MVGTRCSLLVVVALLTAASCGGQSRGRDQAPDPSGEAGSAAAFDLPAKGCRAMDARSNGAFCAGIAGYAWNGSLCEPIQCGCAGTECADVFSSAGDCDRTYVGCYELEGIPMACARHAECIVRTRSCCAPCGSYGPEAMLAMHGDSPDPGDLGLCGSPRPACPECDSWPLPSIYAACIEGQCTVYDAASHASCGSDEDCRLVTKDCCACGGDISVGALMAVDASFGAPDYCGSTACDDCLPPPAPSNVRARCHLEAQQCELQFGSLK